MTARPDSRASPVLASFPNTTGIARSLRRSDTRAYSPRLRTAAALRAQVRDSRGEKVYSRRLPDENRALLSQYSGENNGARRKK